MFNSIKLYLELSSIKFYFYLSIQNQISPK